MYSREIKNATMVMESGLVKYSTIRAKVQEIRPISVMTSVLDGTHGSSVLIRNNTSGELFDNSEIYKAESHLLDKPKQMVVDEEEELDEHNEVIPCPVKKLKNKQRDQIEAIQKAELNRKELDKLEDE